MRSTKSFALALLAPVSILALGIALPPCVQARPVIDPVPPHGSIAFWWTEDNAVIPGTLVTRENKTDYWVDENFGEPPANATDWRQWTEDRNGNKSDVMGGNIKKGSPWHFDLLSNLPDVDWRIPDLIDPTLASKTLYAAVNLDIYLSQNPWPELSPGDVVNVVDGTTAELQGIFWSTTEFTFDPNSANGFVGTPYTGTGTFQGFHTNTVPEPSSALLAGIGLLGIMACTRWRRLKG